MEIPPTLLPLYREKSKNNLACAREQQASQRALAPSWGVLDSRLRTASASWLTLGNHFPHLGLPSSSKYGVVFSELPFSNSITFLFDRQQIRVSLSTLADRKLKADFK